MKIRVQDGRVFQGTPRQLVQQMQDIAIGEHVDWVAARAGQFDGVALSVTGDTDGLSQTR